VAEKPKPEAPAAPRQQAPQPARPAPVQSAASPEEVPVSTFEIPRVFESDRHRRPVEDLDIPDFLK